MVGSIVALVDRLVRVRPPVGAAVTLRVRPEDLSARKETLTATQVLEVARR